VSRSAAARSDASRSDQVRRAAADVAIAVRQLERELAEAHPARLVGPALDDVVDAMGRLTVLLDTHTPAEGVAAP
jgi:hypothetical protein